jgi:diguanylate cyclase (GGDEF)-like protein/PAS domain S-box-containing protein
VLAKKDPENERNPVMQLDYQKLLANIRDGVYFTDLDRRITYWNEGAERISGFSAKEVVGNRCRDSILIHVDERGSVLCGDHCPMAGTIKDRKPREANLYLHHKQGHRVPINVRVMPLTDERGQVVGAAEFFTEIYGEDALQQRIDELEHLALLDPLTQLPNRTHIEQELVSRFHELSRLKIQFGLLFMDIDYFKQFNDTYGHDFGDEVLRTAARTLRASTRPYDLVGRWSGEEFVCVVRNTKNTLELLDIANRMRMLVSQSTVRVTDQLLSITVSLGATLATPSDDIETLVKRADNLMYKSKTNGRNQVTVG